MKKVLVVAAHPDDEVLGCGGVIAKLVKEGAKVYTIIMGEGITSRFSSRETGLKSSSLKKLKASIGKASKILGITKNFSFGFPDNRFDSVQLLDIVKAVESVKKDIKPAVVYTHHWNDLNVDHRIVYEAVITAARPLKGETVKEIYSFEIPSSTEWNYPSRFNPNVFVDISSVIGCKVAALKCYKTELKPFPHPRSPESVMSGAKRWGGVCGAKFAEAFEAVRIIK